MKYESSGNSKESVKKQQDRIRFYESRVKEIEAEKRRKGSASGEIRKQVQNG